MDPTSGLDPAQRQQIENLITQFRRNGMLDDDPARSILEAPNVRTRVESLQRSGAIYDSVAQTLLNVLAKTPGASPTYDSLINKFVGRIPVEEDAHKRVQ